MGTLTADKGDTTPLVAILGARDEGEAIWRLKGHAQFAQWRAKGPLALPFGNDASPAPATPFAPPTFDKRALSLSLDRERNCVGLSVSHAVAQTQKVAGGEQWTLSRALASTKAGLAPAAAPPARPDARLASARALWKAWRTARAGGRWARVEELERELNRALGE